MKTRITAALLAILLLSVCLGPGAAADSDTIRIPAALVSGLYRSDPVNGLNGFLTSEETRCFATICAFLDWHAFDSKADCLLRYTYIGKDKDANILWVGLGGKSSSIVLMYAPDQEPDSYTAFRFEMDGSWVPSLIDLYCRPLYHNSEAVMKSTLDSLQSPVN